MSDNVRNLTHANKTYIFQNSLRAPQIQLVNSAELLTMPTTVEIIRAHRITFGKSNSLLDFCFRTYTSIIKLKISIPKDIVLGAPKFFIKKQLKH